MFRSPLFRKLLFSAFALIALTLLALDFDLTREAKQRQVAATEQLLEAQGRILAGELEHLSYEELPGWTRSAGERARARITLIDARGVVVAESQHDPETMEIHSNRPEVKQAYAGQTGRAIRHSATLNRDMCYVGLPLSYRGHTGSVLRLAVPLSDIDKAIAAVRLRIVIASVIATLMALTIAYIFSRSFTARIRRLQTYAERLAASGFAENLPPDAHDELGALARSLNQMAAGLDRLERVRKDFVANVSHELRTPLTAIQGYAETLLDGALEDRENNRRFLDIIRAHSVRLNNIASDLLVLSELESGGPGGDAEPVPVRSAMEMALRTIESEARLRGVKLITGPLEDVHVMGQKLRLEQVLVNLLSNAVKFNREGGEVRVSIQVADGKVRITVSDTGIGIPTADLSRIFERFYRVDKARSRQVGGTGLGLSIVRHAVERMNGTIAVESEVGTGSKFTVTLPVQADKAL